MPPSSAHVLTLLGVVLEKFVSVPTGRRIGVGRLLRYTEWSGAESLARFGPPGFGLGTLSPGICPGPVL